MSTKVALLVSIFDDSCILTKVDQSRGYPRPSIHTVKNEAHFALNTRCVLFVCFDHLRSINNFSVIKERVFLS